MDKIEIIAQYICVALTGIVFAINPNIATTTAFCFCLCLWFTNKLNDRKRKIVDLEERLSELQSILKVMNDQKAKTDEITKQLESVKNALQLKQLGR